MMTIGAKYEELMGTECPVCHDVIGEYPAVMPTWSDECDDVVCWDCAMGEKK